MRRASLTNRGSSVAQIVGWKLESILPGRAVDVDVRARGGFCLEQALLALDGLDYKPDAILLFSGHNEFHARYGWDRNVADYRRGQDRRPCWGCKSSRLAQLHDARDLQEPGSILRRGAATAPREPRAGGSPVLHAARVSVSARGVPAPARIRWPSIAAKSVRFRS